MDTPCTDDVDVITFKVKGHHVKPDEVAGTRKAAKKRSLEPACDPAPSTPCPTSAVRKRGCALRDRTNLASASKTTVKALKMPTPVAQPEPVPEHKRRRVGFKIDGDYALLTWRSGAEQWAFRLMHSAVTGTLQDLSEHASKDEIIAAIHAVRGSVPSSTPAERCTATAETSFDTLSTCTVAESSPGRWEPEMRQVDERKGISDNGPALGSLDPITPTVDVQSLDTPLPLTVEAPYEHRGLPFLETCTTDELKSCAFVESSVVSENVLVDETASDTFGPHVPKFTEAEVDVIKRTVEASVRHQTESELRAEFEARLEEERTRIAALWRSDLELAVSESVESRSALDKANLLKNELCQTLKELEAEHSSLEAAYGAVVSKEKEVSASLQLCEIRYAASSADKAELQHKLLACMEAREALEGVKQDLTMDKVALERSLAAANASVAELTAKLQVAETAVTAAQLVQTRTVEAFNSKLEQKRVEFVKLKEENASCKAALAETQTVVEALRTTSSKQEADFRSQLASAEARHASDASKIATLEASIFQLQRKLATVTEEASSSQKRLAEIERQHSNCGDELSQVKDELINNFKTQQSQHAKAVTAFESELRDLKVKVYDLTSENRRLTEANTKLTAQEEELLGYVTQLQEKCGLA